MDDRVYRMSKINAEMMIEEYSTLVIKYDRLEQAVRARLEYCQEVNGLSHCKNCGLSEEDLK
jgi:DNA integrity scanning protein DisA with diadenylate cyclase activity